MISIKVNGKTYSDFNYIEVGNQLGILPSYFYVSFTPKANRELFKTLDNYTIEINKEKVQQGKILSVDVFHNEKEEQIIFLGKDNTHFLMKQCSVAVEEQENIELVTFVKKLLNNLVDVESKLEDKIIIPRIKVNKNESVYDSLHRLSKKYGFLLTTNGSKLVLCKEGDGGLLEASLKFKGMNSLDKGRLIEVKLSKNYSSYYDNFIATSFNYNEENNLLYKRNNQLLGLTKFYYVDESVSSTELLNNLEWQAQLNSGLVTKYTIKTLTHSINGIIPKPNMYIHVDDDLCNIHGYMLIYKTKHGYNANNKDYLEMELIAPATFSLDKKAVSLKNKLKLGEKY